MDTNTKPGLLDRLVVKLLNRPAVQAAVVKIVNDDATRRGRVFAKIAINGAQALDEPRFPKGRWS